MLKKVKFNSEREEYFGDYGNGMIEITRQEFYRFISSWGVMCYGNESGYIIYSY